MTARLVPLWCLVAAIGQAADPVAGVPGPALGQVDERSARSASRSSSTPCLPCTTG